MSKREFYIKDLVIDDEYGVIKSDLSIQDAAKKMKELGVPDLVVTDESDNVIGVLADFDIVQDIVAEGKSLDSKVTEAVVSITPVSLETKVTDAFKQMQDLEVNVVPVLDKNGKLLGVATIQDCWSFIPDQDVDDIGLIPVSDPNNAEFWLSSVCAILAFLLGIMLPLTGAVGFFSLPTSFTDLFGVAIIGGESVSFYLFDARGFDFIVTFLTLMSRNPVWALMIINGFLLIISGVLGLFSLIYASYSDLRNVKIGNVVRLLPWLTVVFMVLEWLFYLIAFGTALPDVTVDAGGLVLSIFSMILIIVAINREYIFRQTASPTEEVSA
jgi:CBS domain-containing protein